MAKQKTYDEHSIKILEGLEAVRKRPGMYIGSTDKRGMHHLVWEIVDNSIDEIINGYGNYIKILLHKDGSITVADNGRGVPIGMHESGKSTPEVIYTILHAGGKFETDGYKVSGGLHGVGGSVVNALSSRMEVTIYREGKISQIKFRDGGHVESPLKTIGESKKNGTIVTFLPDKEIFKNIKNNNIYKTDLYEKASLISKTIDISSPSKILNNIIKELDLTKPIYHLTTCFGHFGKNNLPWEKLDKVEIIKSLLN